MSYYVVTRERLTGKLNIADHGTREDFDRWIAALRDRYTVEVEGVSAEAAEAFCTHSRQADEAQAARIEAIKKRRGK